MELVVDVVLLKTEGSVLGGWISSGRSFPSQEMVSKIFWMLLFGSCSDGFPCWCLREILMAKDTCLDLCVGQNLTTTVVRCKKTPIKLYLGTVRGWCQISNELCSFTPTK